uniref:Uncharacterized protein n=1 Tax=Guillardia theta TaxID=55529 RepID=A0A6U5ZEA4_GUITH|mmetsp:Transcript_2558/g.8431  ORF Transcript_2558/g.8431 Transcript_2558/m.8431 type:complete len:101 (+) Transcript_2558:62-364(+)
MQVDEPHDDDQDEQDEQTLPTLPSLAVSSSEVHGETPQVQLNAEAPGGNGSKGGKPTILQRRNSSKKLRTEGNDDPEAIKQAAADAVKTAVDAALSEAFK